MLSAAMTVPNLYASLASRRFLRPQLASSQHPGEIDIAQIQSCRRDVFFKV